MNRHIEDDSIWVSRVNRNREIAEQAFLTLAETCVIEYWDALNSSKYKDVKELEHAEALARSKALKALESFPRRLDGNVVEKVKSDLMPRLDAMYEKTAEQLKNKLSLEGDQANAQEGIEDAVQQYRNSMEAHVSSAST